MLTREGISIRKKRLNTYRDKNNKLILAGKATAFWYVTIVALITLISPTFAGFTSQGVATGVITADTWPVPWDQTGVDLVSNGDLYIETCEPVELSAIFMNKGPYPSIEGNNGISELEEGESQIVTMMAEVEGEYTINASDGETELSKTFIVTCPPPPDPCAPEKLKEEAATENDVVNVSGAGDQSISEAIQENAQLCPQSEALVDGNEGKDYEVSKDKEEGQEVVEIEKDPAEKADEESTNEDNKKADLEIENQETTPDAQKPDSKPNDNPPAVKEDGTEAEAAKNPEPPAEPTIPKADAPVEEAPVKEGE